MAMRSDTLVHPMSLHEAPLPLHLKIMLALSSPLLLALSLARAALFMTCAVACSAIATLTSVKPQPSFAPLSGVRRAVFYTVLRACGRLILLSLGCWPGLLRVEGEHDLSASTVVVAPHTGAVDAFVFLAVLPGRPLVMETYTKIPTLRSLFQNLGAIPVRSKKVQFDDAKQTPRDAILEHQRRYSSMRASSMPLVVFPEGTTHSGHSILRFFDGAFSSGQPVQPVALRYRYKYFNAAAFVDFSLLTHLLRMFGTPWMHVHLAFLPTYQPPKDLDAASVAEATRRIISASAELPLHHMGARQVRRDVLASRRAATSLL